MLNDFSSFFDIFILFPGTKNKYLDGKIIITVKEKMSKRSYNVNETLEIIFSTYIQLMILAQASGMGLVMKI